MMEKALHPHCLIVALTYDDSTQENRDSAAMFNYGDVRAFLHRVRAAARYVDEGAVVRFICAGEQGDRNGRCHWHLILYSSVDLCALGTVKRRVDGRLTVQTDRAQMMTQGNRKRRLDWSLWGRGFVTFQEPDQGGMNYVLSYCLKDQFTGQKSHETKRQAKVENFATGMFRPSKRPAIGEAWLMAKLASLRDSGAVLPSLNIKVPGFHGYYQPHGIYREKVLSALVAANGSIRMATGRDAPQWSSLLASCKDNPKDMEILNGTSPEQAEELEFEFPFTRGFGSAQSRAETRLSNAAKFRPQCAATLPCKGCLSVLPDETLQALGVVRKWAFVGASAEYVYRAAEGQASVESRQSDFAGRLNPYCRKRGARIVAAENPRPFEGAKGRKARRGDNG